jgi:hypothetical protein
LTGLKAVAVGGDGLLEPRIDVLDVEQEDHRRAAQHPVRLM